MRLFTTKVFQGLVAGAAQPTPFYTPPEFETLLASADGLIIEVVLSDVSGSPSAFSLDTQWSNTGSSWITRSADSVQISNPASGTSSMGASGCDGDRMRLALKLSGANTSANVAVYVCGRGEQSWM